MRRPGHSEFSDHSNPDTRLASLVMEGRSHLWHRSLCTCVAIRPPAHDCPEKGLLYKPCDFHLTIGCGNRRVIKNHLGEENHGLCLKRDLLIR